MSDQDKILQFIQYQGPTIPAKVAKNINEDLLITSAHLSDLKARGKLKISYLKIGGSPLYYLHGQEEKLYSFAEGNLNPKDLEVLQLLKQKKVLREAHLDLLARVALRSLKDFAIPLHVTMEGTKELFWKWYLLTDEELNNLIRELLEGPFPAQENGMKAVPVEENIPIQSDGSPTQESISKPEIVEEKREAGKIDRQEEHAQGPVSQEISSEEDTTTRSQEEKKPFFQKVKERISRRKEVMDEFFPLVENYFKELDIKIEQKETVRKNAEMNLIIKVPSVVGKINYYCKAKAKGRCDEKDLSSAYIEAQMKKLPLLFLYTKEITKKSQEMMDSGAFENAIIKKIE